jgi:hypothetical protein
MAGRFASGNDGFNAAATTKCDKTTLHRRESLTRRSQLPLSLGIGGVGALLQVTNKDNNDTFGDNFSDGSSNVSPTRSFEQIDGLVSAQTAMSV